MTTTPRSLVTGVAGFIGSHVADELLARGHRVLGLDDLSGGSRRNVPAGVELVRGSICDASLVDALVARHRPQYVFHLAAYAAEGLSHFIRRFNYTNNLVGSVNLLNAAINTGGVRRFVFTSSIAVYGSSAPPMTEDMPPAPEDPYGIAKHAVEQDLHAAARLFAVPYTIFRPHNVYGERQNLADRYRNVVGIFMNQAMRGEPFTIFGDGSQRRAFTHISDVAPAIARSVELDAAANQVFNIGGDVPCTVNELAEVVAEAMGVPLRVRREPPRDEVVDAWSDHRRLRAVFGAGGPLVPLREGIARMAAWARAAGPAEPSVFEGIEVPVGLPPSWRSIVTSPSTTSTSAAA